MNMFINIQLFIYYFTSNFNYRVIQYLVIFMGITYVMSSMPKAAWHSWSYNKVIEIISSF